MLGCTEGHGNEQGTNERVGHYSQRCEPGYYDGFLIIMVVLELEYAGVVREGIAKSVKTLETVNMIAAKRTLGCSKATRSAMSGSGLGMHQVISNGDRRNRKRKCSERGTG